MRHLTERSAAANAHPRPRHLRVDPAHGADAIAGPIVRDLAPRGPLEELIAGRIGLAAAQLSAGGSPRDERIAERSLIRLLATFDRLRRQGGWGRAEARAAEVVREEDLPLGAPIEFAPVGDDPDLDAALDASRLWRGRLTMDENVSTTSPVVRGTWVTVNHVVTLVVDGWSWSDILRDHPELAEADIRACLTYAVEEDGMGPVS